MKTTSLFWAGVLLLGLAATPGSAGPKGVGGARPAPRPAPKPPAVSGHVPTTRPNPTPAVRPTPTPTPKPAIRPTPTPSPMPKPTPKPTPMPAVKPSIPTTKPGLVPTTKPKPPITPGDKPSTLPGNIVKPTPMPGIVDKPTTLPGNITKPMLPNRPETKPTNPFNPGGGATTLPSKPIIGGGNNNGNVNKPTWINNRPNINNGGNTINTGGNRYNNITNVTNNNFYTNYNSYRPTYNRPWGGWSGNYWSGYYGGWHSSWHVGYWGSSAGWFTAGLATGWLLAPHYATYTYVNPFYVAPVVPTTTVVYNYSQPIVTVPVTAPATTAATDVPVEIPRTQTPAPPVRQTALSPQEKAAPDVTKLSEDEAKALQTQVEAIVNDARNAFKVNDFVTALSKMDDAIHKLPNDPALHEFRALVLFARGDATKGDYKNASAAIYSVLASGPGWNWDTLSKLYADTKVYGTQLKALEKHFKDNPTAGEDAFLLAYHYLTLEEKDAAIRMLESTQKLIPGDELSKKMLDFLKNPPKAPATSSEKPKPGN